MKEIKRLKKLAEIFDSVKSYRHRSVFYRFWIVLIIALIAVFAAIFLIVGSYNNTKHYNNMAGMFSKNMYNMRNSVDSIFAEIALETNKIAKNDIIISGRVEPQFDEAAADEIETFLREVHSETDFVKSVYLYYPKSDYIVSSSVIYESASRADFSDTMWYDTFYSGESEVFLRDYPEKSVFQRCISVCKKVGGSDDLIAVFNMNYDKFNILRNKNTLMEYEVSMINSEGSILYSSDNEKVGKNVNSYKNISDTFYLSVNNYVVNTNMTKVSLLECVQAKNQKLGIVAEIPKKNMDAVSSNRNSIFFIAILIMVLLLALSLILAVKFYGSILSAFGKVTSDSTNGDRSTDEITDISNRISSIINKKNETETELAESLMELQKAQSIALQSQFSPHFLFNTLQMINSIAFAELDGDSDITTAVSLLCDILRVAMDTTEYTCRLGDEIEFAKKYIKLQNMKYENAFEVEFDVDADTLDITVAKLCLQPLLENSMHHGFDSRRGRMSIRIEAHITDGKLVMTIADDGFGMTEERKKEVIQNLDNKQIEKKDSIGLLNLNQRIKLIFGHEYGCSIDNNECGVTVTVLFPCR